jgi:Protein of unknown function (DUF2877)
MTAVSAASPATAAASVMVRDLLAGPPRPATVLDAGPAATYLDVAGRLVAVVAAAAVQVPCAVVLAGDAVPPGGDGLAVGRRAVLRDGSPVVAVRRWFDPRVEVDRFDPPLVAVATDLVRARRRRDDLVDDDAADRLPAALEGDVDATVAALVGRGTGLTPAGDDLVAGALAALRAVGSPAAGPLGGAVRSRAPGATTRLSAALLLDADHGAVIPEAAALLRALGGTGDLARAVDRLVAVGGTSGWHLAAGVVAGAAVAVGSSLEAAP